MISIFTIAAYAAHVRLSILGVHAVAERTMTIVLCLLLLSGISWKIYSLQSARNLVVNGDFESGFEVEEDNMLSSVGSGLFIPSPWAAILPQFHGLYGSWNISRSCCNAGVCDGGDGGVYSVRSADHTNTFISIRGSSRGIVQWIDLKQALCINELIDVVFEVHFRARARTAASSSAASLASASPSTAVLIDLAPPHAMRSDASCGNDLVESSIQVGVISATSRWTKFTVGVSLQSLTEVSASASASSSSLTTSSSSSSSSNESSAPFWLRPRVGVVLSLPVHCLGDCIVDIDDIEVIPMPTTGIPAV